MSSESYLTHPNFGMLYRVCMIDTKQELFTTLYAQRLFFVAKTDPVVGLAFDPIGRSEARLILETRLRMLRQAGQHSEYDQLQKMYKQTFQ